MTPQPRHSSREPSSPAVNRAGSLLQRVATALLFIVFAVLLGRGCMTRLPRAPQLVAQPLKRAESPAKTSFAVVQVPATPPVAASGSTPQGGFPEGALSRRVSSRRLSPQRTTLSAEPYSAGGPSTGTSSATGNGATARPVPQPNGDSIIARRLRKAAEQETDPRVKARLQSEYVEYQNNAQQK
jgi:hypothetical protein